MKNRFLFSLLLIASLFVSAQSDKKLNKLFLQIDKINRDFSNGNPVWSGKHPATFTYQSFEKQIEKTKQLAIKLDELKDINPENLSRQGQINREIKMLQLTDQISSVDYKLYLIPFNSEGGFYNSPSFFLPNLPFETAADFEAYLKWLPSFADYINYHIDLLRMGVKEEIMAPKVIVQNNIRLLEPWTSDDLSGNPFYAPVSDQPLFNEQGGNVLRDDILPAYRKLKSFLEEEYLPAAPDAIGISAINNGSAYYENRIRHFTTLDISPDSVYATGVVEVQRIKALMQEIIDEVGFEGSFADFIAFLRTDQQFYPQTPEALLSRAAWLSKKAEGQLPRLFSQLYELPFTVEPVPDDIAPNYTGGRYVGGSRAGNRAGIYWVNTYNLSSRPFYTLPALTLHEAVPGHHLQITLASELEDLPSFRRSYYISAFGEGWGLYSEYLGEEMGMYETPYELFGRYTYEMWRACRLVIDVGIHYKGWTRDEAVKFMAENTALSLHEVNTEIDRYIGWPGQAVSYKMGELMIKKLRQKCETALGEAFSIQEFHQVILKNGSVPLPILEEEIEIYLKAKAKE